MNVVANSIFAVYRKETDEGIQENTLSPITGHLSPVKEFRPNLPLISLLEMFKDSPTSHPVSSFSTF